MSAEQGGDGYGKVKKSFQTGGASGWAKHCGDTHDHQLSNRLERRSNKQALKSGSGGGGNRLKGKRVKPPTRKHLMDRLAHVERTIAAEEKYQREHVERMREVPVERADGLRTWDSGKYHRELLAGRKKVRAEILKEFKEYGYEKP